MTSQAQLSPMAYIQQVSIKRLERIATATVRLFFYNESEKGMVIVICLMRRARAILNNCGCFEFLDVFVAV